MMVIRNASPEKVNFRLIHEGWGEACHPKSLGGSIPGGGNSTCPGPEVEKSLAGSRNWQAVEYRGRRRAKLRLEMSDEARSCSATWVKARHSDFILNGFYALTKEQHNLIYSFKRPLWMWNDFKKLRMEVGEWSGSCGCGPQDADSGDESE